MITELTRSLGPRAVLSNTGKSLMANSALSSISFLRLGKQGRVRLLIRYKQAGPGCAQGNTHLKASCCSRLKHMDSIVLVLLVVCRLLVRYVRRWGWVRAVQYRVCNQLRFCDNSRTSTFQFCRPTTTALTIETYSILFKLFITAHLHRIESHGKQYFVASELHIYL